MNVLLHLTGHKERIRALENQVKSLGEEPDARAKKSSSGSDSDVDWPSGVDSKLREAEASLLLEREQREKIEKELHDLKAVAAQVYKNEVGKFIHVCQCKLLNIIDLHSFRIVKMYKFQVMRKNVWENNNNQSPTAVCCH